MALISVIIPVFNCERYIAAAVESVFKQTLAPSEIIVVDDGSTDATPRILAAFNPPVTVIRQPNRGGVAASNRGVEMSTGRFLCFLDADDLWSHDKVARQFDRLTKHSDKEAVFGLVQQFISDDLAPHLASRLACPQAPQPGICKTNMMIRRDAFERIGLFDSTLRSIDFLEWYTRATENGLQVDMLAEVVAFRRLHAMNYGSARRDEQRSENLEVLKRALDRRRSRFAPQSIKP